MGNIAWFRDLSKGDTAKVGGKGANLSEMYNADIPIPPGFCITVDAYKQFLDETGIDIEIYSILKNLNVEDTTALHEAAERIQEIILSEKMPAKIKNDIIQAYDNMNIDIDIFKSANKDTLAMIKAGRDLPYVAVRSSATAEDQPEHSFAGQNETYLNIRGNENLVKAVQKCWASLFGARSIFYRVVNKLEHEKVFISVVVQKMVNATEAGVIFTANPATNNTDEIVIEAGLGLGEAVVSGAINPDTYIVDKNTFAIKDKKIARQDFMIVLDQNLGRNVRRTLEDYEATMQKLSDEKIIKLAKLAKLVEIHYEGKPQDLEFANEGPRILIVQTRAITTLKPKEEIKTEEKHGEVIITGLGASPGIASGVVKIVKTNEDLEKVKAGDVLVTHMTNPDMAVGYKKVCAIITDEGGTTCHAAIVSRELGIPAVVGTEKATQILKEGDEITVDGREGKVYRGKIAIETPKFAAEEVSAEKLETVTEVKVIVDMPEIAEKAAKTGADGVGLLRVEFLILGMPEHPYFMITSGKKNEFVEKLADGLRTIAKAFNGKPVWYRTMDAPTDEFRRMKGGENEPEEDNPMMGWRSIRRDLDQPEMLTAQFEAIKKLHSEGLTNIGVMLPLVTHVEQIKKAKEYLRQVGLEPLEEIEFGVMIETPASVQIIKEICEEGVDFVSFGTNDLTQFTLAVDRNNARIQKLYDEMHPAVLRQIKQVIDVCKKYGVETSVCGQSASRMDMVEWLVKAGIDSISPNPDAVQEARRIVARTEKKLLLGVAREKLNE